MIRIAITRAAFDAIAETLALGSVAYEAEANGASAKSGLRTRGRIGSAQSGGRARATATSSCGWRKTTREPARSPFALPRLKALRLHAILNREGALLALRQNSSGWTGIVHFANDALGHHNIDLAKALLSHSEAACETAPP
jgi:hypothetical protein